MLIMQTANAAGHAPAASPAPSASPTIPASAHTKATLHSRLSHWQSTHRHTYRMAAGSNESSFLLIMVSAFHYIVLFWGGLLQRCVTRVLSGT
ncbi:MAG: hypothetical protein WAX82_08485, partial [Gemmiger qucibialis]